MLSAGDPQSLFELRKQPIGCCVKDVDSPVLVLHAIQRTKKLKWRLRNFALQFTSADEALCKTWHRKLTDKLAELNRPKHLLVFVNPYGGRGKAQHIFKRWAKPVFDACLIETTVIVTQRANHAYEVLQEMQETDLDSFDGVVSVGGDGLYNECLQGLIHRTQRAAGISVDDRRAHLVRPRLKLGTIPGGSTNALIYTVNGSQCPVTAVLHIAIGDTIGLDVCSVHTANHFLRYACTAVSYGFLGDVLRDSERLRSVGPIRYTLAGLQCIFKHRSYAGRVEYVASDHPELATLNLSDASNRCQARCVLCTSGCDDVPADSSAISNHFSEPQMETQEQWSKLEESTFLHIVGAVTPCLCQLAPRGLSPMGHLGDGCLDLALVGSITRALNVSFMSKVIFRNADHLRSRFVHAKRVKAFTFTPPPTEDGAAEVDHGVWNVDGEIVRQTDETFYFRVHRQAVSFFGRGVEFPGVGKRTANRATD